MTPLWADKAILGGHAFGPRRITAWLFGTVAWLAIASVIPASAAVLQVSVIGVRNDKGFVGICLFDSDQGFPGCAGNPTVIARRQHASPGTMRFDFDVSPGIHAVSVLHDENGNGWLDTNFLGIPIEGGGGSNNPPPRMGPPRFADALFRLQPEGGHIVVKLVYP